MTSFVTETIILGTHYGRVLDDGSRSVTEINPPLTIPITAKSVGIKLRNSYIWNTFVNISPSSGNRLTIFTGPGLLDRYDIVYTTGQYSLDEFNSYFVRESIRQQAPWIDKATAESDLNFEADMAVQKAYISNNGAGEYRFSWFREDASSLDGTVWNLLGFEPDTETYIPPTSDVEPFSFTYAPNTANFNSVNSILMLCSLVSKGLRNGGRQQSILAQIPITEDPGSLMVYEPQHTLISEPTLVGHTIRSVELTMTNENGILISTPGNSWQVTVEISYELMH